MLNAFKTTGFFCVRARFLSVYMLKDLWSPIARTYVYTNIYSLCMYLPQHIRQIYMRWHIFSMSWSIWAYIAYMLDICIYAVPHVDAYMLWTSRTIGSCSNQINRIQFVPIIRECAMCARRSSNRLHDKCCAHKYIPTIYATHTLHGPVWTYRRVWCVCVCVLSYRRRKRQSSWY